MWKHLVLAPALAFAAGSFAQQDHHIGVEATVPEVTVYLNGAEVRTGADIALKAGRNTVVFAGLSPQLYDESVQAAVVALTGPDPAILGVSMSMGSVDPGSLNPRITVLTDSAKLLRARITDLEDRVLANEAEREMLGRNHAIGGSAAVVSAEQIARAADFFRERTLAVHRAISGLRVERDHAREELARVEERLAVLARRHDPRRKEVAIVLAAPQDQRARVDLRYLVGRTGWAPVYDLVAGDITRPVLLRYKAQVYNNTGIDWRGVRLVLSTADPSLGANKPELDPWYLGARDASKSSGTGRQATPGPGQSVIARDSNLVYETISVAETGAELPIARPCDIPSDAKPHFVEVAEHELPATYSHSAVPKLDRNAFLLARITEWRELDLVEGRANVYYGGSFVGESRINTFGADDTLDLSLGRDRSVSLERRLKEEMTSKRFIGGDRRETTTYEITVRNNGKAPVALDVLDQVPVSRDTDFKVSLLELSKGQVDQADGTVTWRAEVPAGGVVKYVLSYAVQYPRGRSPSSIRKSRMVYSPRFL